MGQRRAGIDQIGLGVSGSLRAIWQSPGTMRVQPWVWLRGALDRRGCGIENIAGAVAQVERGLGRRGSAMHRASTTHSSERAVIIRR